MVRSTGFNIWVEQWRSVLGKFESIETISNELEACLRRNQLTPRKCSRNRSMSLLTGIYRCYSTENTIWISLSNRFGNFLYRKWRTGMKNTYKRCSHSQNNRTHGTNSPRPSWACFHPVMQLSLCSYEKIILASWKRGSHDKRFETPPVLVVELHTEQDSRQEMGTRSHNQSGRTKIAHVCTARHVYAESYHWWRLELQVNECILSQIAPQNSGEEQRSISTAALENFILSICNW